MDNQTSSLCLLPFDCFIINIKTEKIFNKKTCAYQNIINDMRCRFIFHRRQKENNSFSVKRVTKRTKNNVKKVKKKIMQKY